MNSAKSIFLDCCPGGYVGNRLSHSDGAVVAVIAALGFTLLFTRHRTVVISISVLVFAIALLLPPVKQCSYCKIVLVKCA